MHVIILNWRTSLTMCTITTEALNPLGYRAIQRRILNRFDI